MQEWLQDIREKTKNMDRKEKIDYVLQYYWHYLLGVGAVIALIFFVIYHSLYGQKDKVFTCILVNQEIDSKRDGQIQSDFAKFLNVEEDKICVDSNYLISYGNVQLEGINESSYEKFFFNWSVNELDAIIMPESFYKYCIENGGEFLPLNSLLDVETLKQRGLNIYEDQGIAVGLRLENTDFFTEARLHQPLVEKEQEEPLLLAFPNNTKHKEHCAIFLQFIK